MSSASLTCADRARLACLVANDRIYTLFDFMAFILILSPNKAPPVFLLDGSTDTIAMFLSEKSAINLLTNSSTNDDLPAPPVPVTPRTGVDDCIAISFIFDKIVLCFSGQFSAAEIKRAIAFTFLFFTSLIPPSKCSPTKKSDCLIRSFIIPCKPIALPSSG
ncbi:MAG: Uncharacterised protein [Cryomorphaceae bacterium]|nr:MAG: Uncharacterised protein [Cryomorphaceae bacterium]